MMQTHIAETNSLDAWAQSGCAISGMTETGIVTDQSLQSSGPTRGCFEMVREGGYVKPAFFVLSVP
jgi:hypothetical protein